MIKRIIRPGLLAAALLGTPLTSCISVKAPDKPIEINLNVTIRQEVLVRLQRDVEQLINQNPQAFPQPDQAMKSLVFIAAFVLAAPATAQTPAVDAARAAGIIGERYDGYIGVHGAASAAVRSQVARINIERRSLYIDAGIEQGRQPAGRRHHRRLPAARAGRCRRSLYAGRRRLASPRGRPVGGARLLPLSFERVAVVRPQSPRSAGE